MSNFYSNLGHPEYKNDIASTSTSNSHPRYRNVPFDLIELSIETLLGTSYEVRLSGRTTIAFLKSKLQRSEGIPKHHLHLIHRGKFCVDSSCVKLNLNYRLKSINTVCYKYLNNIQTGRELPDSLSLEECGVENGATLKLILAMRGGPINTRRVVISNTSGRNPSEHGPNENATSSHIEDIMLKNKDKLLDKIPKNGQVFEFFSIIIML